MTEREAHDIFLREYNRLGAEIALAHVNELENQGHRATGGLIKSVVFKVQELLDDIEGALSHWDYGIIVNSGVTAERVPYTRGSGAGVSRFIESLMNWIRLKGIAGGLDKDVKSVAFAMATAMKRDGIPTRGSYAFSSNGRRTGWIDFVYNHFGMQWADDLELIGGDYIDNTFTAMLEKTVGRYDSLELSLAA